MVTTIKATHIVKPAEPTPQEFMYLSEIDQVRSLTHAPTVYFYRPTRDISLEEAAQILKDSLSKVLVRFYPLAGRLSWTHGGRVELHCSAKGALLVEAESDLKIDDFGDFCPTSETKSLVPSVDLDATPIHEVPLILSQVTKFSCGGISFGTGFSHVMLDGQSAGEFVVEWSKIARGEHSDDLPFLDRTVLKQYEQENPSLPNFKLSDIYPLPFLLGNSDNLAERKKETTPMMMRLSKEQIETLRSKASDNQYSYSFTRFQIICAHIWKCVSMARGLKPDQETILFVTVNFRNRVDPPLPERYSGNAIVLLPLSSTVGELLSNPLSHTARKIKKGVESINDKHVRSYISCIKNTPDVSNMRYFHTVGCAKGWFFGNPNLMITCWNGIPVFGAQFGWGKEVFLGPGNIGYDGKTFAIPGQNGDGSFCIAQRLQVEHAAAYKKCFYEQI